MRTTGPRKRRDDDTSLPVPGAVAVVVMLAALTAEWPAQHAAAQSPPCTAIENDAERLACYDRALRTASPAPTAQAPAAPATQAPAPPAGSPAAQAPTVQTPPAAQAAPAPSARAAPTSAGKDIIPIVVVNVRTVPGRETSFTTQDGATWVQTDSQRIYGLPDPPFDAELKPGAVGSTFLVPKNGSRAIRVKLSGR